MTKKTKFGLAGAAAIVMLAFVVFAYAGDDVFARMGRFFRNKDAMAICLELGASLLLLVVVCRSEWKSYRRTKQKKEKSNKERKQ